MASKTTGRTVASDAGATTSREFVPWTGDPTIVKRILVAFRLTGNVRLIGESGAGKSTIIQTLDDESNDGPFSGDIRKFYADKAHGAGALNDSFWATYNGKGWHLYPHSLTQDTSRWDLVATQTLTAGSVSITPGPIMQWLDDDTPNTRKVLFLDEANYGAPGVTALWNQLTDFRKSIFVSELAIADKMAVEKGELDMKPEKWGTRIRDEDHWFVTAENPYDVTNYAGTSPPNIAQISRLTPVVVPFMSERDEIQMLMGAVGGKGALRGRVTDIVRLASQLREKYRRHELSFVLSPRNTRVLAQLFDATGDWDIVTSTIRDWFPNQDQAEVAGIVTKSSKV